MSFKNFCISESNNTSEERALCVTEEMVKESGGISLIQILTRIIGASNVRFHNPYITMVVDALGEQGIFGPLLGCSKKI